MVLASMRWCSFGLRFIYRVLKLWHKQCAKSSGMLMVSSPWCEIDRHGSWQLTGCGET